jgi:hypothetical protein
MRSVFAAPTPTPAYRLSRPSYDLCRNIVPDDIRRWQCGQCMPRASVERECKTGRSQTFALHALAEHAQGAEWLCGRASPECGIAFENSRTRLANTPEDGLLVAAQRLVAVHGTKRDALNRPRRLAKLTTGPASARQAPWRHEQVNCLPRLAPCIRPRYTVSRHAPLREHSALPKTARSGTPRNAA